MPEPRPIALTVTRRWQHLARRAGHALARREATMADYRMWHCSALRYAGDVEAAEPLALDGRARWWARWLPWWLA